MREGCKERGGQVWLVTGASTGIGRALAEEVIARGGRLAATARDPSTLEALVAAAPDRVLACRLDVTAPDEIGAAIAMARDRFGEIDVLVNNAGFGFLAAIEEGIDAEVRALFETNVFGLAAVTRAALPFMRARQTGTIVNISSMSGFRANAGAGYYAATKWAVEAISEALAREVEPFGLKVLIVEPGPFRTDFAGRSIQRPSNALPAYESAVAIRASSANMHDRQQGDPVRAARLIADAVAAPDAPLRLILGGWAYEAVIATVEERLEGLRLSKDVAALADFPPS